jgi:hypothetical protein
MVYPGVTMIFQGLYPFVTGDYFNLVGDLGPWMAMLGKLGVSPQIVSGLKTVLGLMGVAGVLGLWAGDGRAYPLALLAAVLTLLYPGGGMVMAALALVCLIFFRERAEEVPA